MLPFYMGLPQRCGPVLLFSSAHKGGSSSRHPDHRPTAASLAPTMQPAAHKAAPHPENQSSSAFRGNSATQAHIPLQEGLDVRPPRHYGPATLNLDRWESKKPSETTGKTLIVKAPGLGGWELEQRIFLFQIHHPLRGSAERPGWGGGSVSRIRKMLPRSCTAKRAVWGGGWSLNHQVLDPIPQHLEGSGIP